MALPVFAEALGPVTVALLVEVPLPLLVFVPGTVVIPLFGPVTDPKPEVLPLP